MYQKGSKFLLFYILYLPIIKKNSHTPSRIEQKKKLKHTNMNAEKKLNVLYVQKKYGGFILALFISACHKVRIIKKI